MSEQWTDEMREQMDRWEREDAEDGAGGAAGFVSIQNDIRRRGGFNLLDPKQKAEFRAIFKDRKVMPGIVNNKSRMSADQLAHAMGFDGPESMAYAIRDEMDTKKPQFNPAWEETPPEGGVNVPFSLPSDGKRKLFPSRRREAEGQAKFSVPKGGGMEDQVSRTLSKDPPPVDRVDDLKTITTKKFLSKKEAVALARTYFDQWPQTIAGIDKREVLLYFPEPDAVRYPDFEDELDRRIWHAISQSSADVVDMAKLKYFPMIPETIAGASRILDDKKHGSRIYVRRYGKKGDLFGAPKEYHLVAVHPGRGIVKQTGAKIDAFITSFAPEQGGLGRYAGLSVVFRREGRSTQQPGAGASSYHGGSTPPGGSPPQAGEESTPAPGARQEGEGGKPRFSLPSPKRRLFRGGEGTGIYMYGKGRYSTPSKKLASSYGNVKEVFGYPENPLVVERNEGFFDVLLRLSGEPNMREFGKKHPDPGEFLMGLGYDGVIDGEVEVLYPNAKALRGEGQAKASLPRPASVLAGGRDPEGTRRLERHFRGRGLDLYRMAEHAVKYLPAGGKPAEDIIGTTPEGREYLQKVERAWWEGRRKIAAWSRRLNEARRGLSKEDKAYIRTSFLKDYEEGGAGRRWRSPEVAAFARAWRDTNEEIAAAAGERIEQFKGRDPESYVPHRLTDRGREILQKRNGPEWDALVEAARVNGIELTVLLGLRQDALKQTKYGSIDFARIANLPWEVRVGGQTVSILREK